MKTNLIAKRTLTVIAATLAIASTQQASAQEPAFCQVEQFMKLERGNNVPYLDRAHVFQIGGLTVAGLGVGDSDYRYVQALANQYGDYRADEKSCVFYFNDGNKDAAQAFTHVYAPSPVLRGKSIAEMYDALITPLIDQSQPNFLSCARKHKFIAMGCDGMRHRGPSVFAMFLAYAGCSPENATAIANKIWGTNHVPTGTRKEIARQGFEAGNKNPEGRKELQEIISLKN